MPRMKKKTEYYVNNKEFLEAITVYRNAVIKAREAEDPLSLIHISEPTRPY